MATPPDTKRRKPNAVEPTAYALQDTSPVASTSELATQQPSPPPQQPPPISALQARRAAQAAQAALLPPPKPASDYSESDTDEVARALASSTDQSDGEQSAVHAAQARLAKRRAKLDKAKGKGKQAGRYFAGGAEGGGERVGAAAAAMELDRQPSQQGEEVKKAKMGRGKRQRREKRSVTPPRPRVAEFCVSLAGVHSSLPLLVWMVAVRSWTRRATRPSSRHSDATRSSYLGAGSSSAFLVTRSVNGFDTMRGMAGWGGAPLRAPTGWRSQECMGHTMQTPSTLPGLHGAFENSSAV